MTAAVGSAGTAGALDRMLELLPTHHRARDLAPDGTTGPLTELLRAAAGELALLEEDVERLHEGWFIETCEEWLVPYLADLVGLHEVPPDLGVAVSRRALVANTVAYRRRKGTVAVLEQVTRDVTGWPTRAVEHHPLLVASTHVNHVRLDRPAVGDLRSALRGEAAAVVSPGAARGALDPFQKTAEVRRIASRRGRYGIRNVAILPFPVQAYEVGAAAAGGTRADDGWALAVAKGDNWHALDPLGRDVPLFAAPQAEQAIERLAAEPDLPVPLRPRRLLALLTAARADRAGPEGLPLGFRLDGGSALDPVRIRVCRLEDLAPDLVGEQVMVDAITGRVRAYRRPAAGDPATPFAPGEVWARYAYGAIADVGAGTYDRSDVHDRVLTTDRWTRPAEGAGAGDDAQVAVPGDEATPQDALDRIDEGERATFTVSIEDNGRHAGGVHVTVPEATRLVVVAASWPMQILPGGVVRAPAPGDYAPDGLWAHLDGDLAVTGEPGSSVVVDGLVVDGDVVVRSGDLGSLTVAHCTVKGSVRVLGAASGPNASLQVRILRSVVGAVDVADAVPLVSVSDSVLDGAGIKRIGGAALHASLEGTTVRGRIDVRSLDASSCILQGRAEVEHRQIGCVRFSYVEPGSRTPRRHRCVPEPGEETAVVPAYLSTEPGSPAYLVLAASCSPRISEGGEGDAEMGVHHHLRRPSRLRAAQRQLTPYLPVGVELGIFGS
jgi:hypothetical protein